MNAAWGGVDVGGRRKGLHCAILQGHAVVALERLGTPDEVVDLLNGHSVQLAGVDSPRTPAPDGERARRCELEFLRERLCNIRFTPDRTGLNSNTAYYEWIEHGFELYEACRVRGVEVIECFPTASWTVWAGRRDGQRRSRWTREALDARQLEGVPRRTNQDLRDAIAAALTAHAHHARRTRSFGDLVIPL
jgi:predicted nuclease with RNAse H fold